MLDRLEKMQHQHKGFFKHRKLFIIIIVVIITTTVIIFWSRVKITQCLMGDFHPWSLPAERLSGIFFPRHRWKQFLVVWILCILWIIKGLSWKEPGKGRVLIIINSAKANNILG